MIPAFNAAMTIVDTLESVRQQNYRPIELVIINDGSTDQTASVVQQWLAQKDLNQIMVLFHEHANMGLLRSRKIGLEISRGSILQFLDSDDLLHPDKFCECVPILSEKEWDVVVTKTDKFSAANMDQIREQMYSAPHVRRWSKWQLRWSTITSNPWRTVGPLFSRDIVERANAFPEYVDPVAEELEFHARIKLLTNKIYYVNKVLSFYRKRDVSSLTHCLDNLYEGRIRGAGYLAALLKENDARSLKEWLSLVYFALRTHYQVINCSRDGKLEDRSWQGFQETLQSWAHPLGALFQWIPRCAVRFIFVTIFRLKSRYASWIHKTNDGRTVRSQDS